MKPHRSIATQFGRFLVVGGIATATHYCILILVVEALGVRPVIASGFGFLLGALVNYQLNRHFTFRSAATHGAALPRFFAIAGVGLALNQGLMHVFSTRLAWPYLLAQVAATGLVLLWNFAGNSLWTFRARS